MRRANLITILSATALAAIATPVLARKAMPPPEVEPGFPSSPLKDWTKPPAQTKEPAFAPPRANPTSCTLIFISFTK